MISLDIEKLIDKYQLNKSESQVLRFMEKNKPTIKNMGIREVAKHCFVSPASIINMAKKIGFSGYSELLYSFLNTDTSENAPHTFTDDEKNKFIELFLRYHEKRIMVLGFGFSQIIANYFSEYLNLYGFRSSAHSHLELIRKTNKDDILIILISNSGNTVRLAELASMSDEQNIETIAFVGERNSKIGSLATLTISTETHSSQSFKEFSPNLFFGTALNQFELLMSEVLKLLYA